MEPSAAHMRPPETMRLLMKKWQKSSPDDIEKSREIINLAPGAIVDEQLVSKSGSLNEPTIRDVFHEFIGDDATNLPTYTEICYSSFEVKALPGLFVFPKILPPPVQTHLLDKLLHRDLSNQVHKNNLDLHYDISRRPFPSDGSAGDESTISFFEADQDTLLQPREPSVHKPLSIRQMLDRKLRWITLGGQYDWTAKVYPTEHHPQFPRDIHELLSSIWPNVDAQAAIVNLYTPGDTLSVHRDVSEECDRGLISISIGCDALFIVGNHDGSHTATIKLHSGDAVLMSGEARFAWHAVPKIIPNTCPNELQDWPYSTSNPRFQRWRGWMKSKRINLNVRQMHLDS